jgi:hypothetical protein
MLACLRTNDLYTFVPIYVIVPRCFISLRSYPSTGPAEWGGTFRDSSTPVSLHLNGSYCGTSNCAERASCTAPLRLVLAMVLHILASFFRPDEWSQLFRNRSRRTFCCLHSAFRLQHQFFCILTCCVSGPAREVAAVLVSPFCSRLGHMPLLFSH